MQVLRSRRDDDTSLPSSHRAPVWNQEFQLLVMDPNEQVSPPKSSCCLPSMHMHSSAPGLPAQHGSKARLSKLVWLRPLDPRLALQVLDIAVEDNQLTGRPSVGRIHIPLARIPKDGCMTAWLPLEQVLHPSCMLLATPGDHMQQNLQAHTLLTDAGRRCSVLLSECSSSVICGCRVATLAPRPRGSCTCSWCTRPLRRTRLTWATGKRRCLQG